MYREAFQKAYGRMVVRSWSDEAFRERFLSDPIDVFKEHGIDVPEGVHVKVLENTDKEVHFILPSKSEETCREFVCGVEELCTCYMLHVWKTWF
jgi:hypothetical protein